MDFAEYLEASGLVYDPEVTWIAFHGEYDFPYLLHLLKNEPLPETIDEFYKDLKLYFRTIYDLKLIIYDKERVSGLGLDDFSQ
jgi:CCR4-NOT transcription complex subunit 7/8